MSSDYIPSVKEEKTSLLKRLNNLKSAEGRARYLSRIKKNIIGFGTKGYENTIPFFVAGWQRSGTTMLMNVFHLHPQVEVYNEAHNSMVFQGFRIKNLKVLEKSIIKSPFPFTCYKIICDSHILRSFIDAFPTGKFVWMYRDAADNAESLLRKFSHATRAVRLVSLNQPGGGWFAEGVSPKIAIKLREFASRELTEFDYACLAWWARNSLFFELGLDKTATVRVLQYEKLVQEPEIVMKKLFTWLGVEWNENAFQFVNSRSVGKPNLPKIDIEVESLCDELKSRLDHELVNDWQ